MNDMESSREDQDDLDPVLLAYQGALDRARAVAEVAAIEAEAIARCAERAAEFHLLAEGYKGLLSLRPPEHLGPYKIRRVLAEGGMGTIYLAEEEGLASDRLVAVKTVKFGRHADPGLVSRFERERRTLARLHHTHIVSLFASGCERDLLYFAMPFIRGVTLRGLIKAACENGSSSTPSTFEELVKEASDDEAHENATRETRGLHTTAAPAPPPTGDGGPAAAVMPRDYLSKVVLLIIEVADAVQHAHESGIIHRDLKPSNIMIERHAHAWLIDFGLATDHDGETAATPPEVELFEGLHDEPAIPSRGGVVGTRAYMAPEQFDERADERTDVWALGVVLYELLTLHRAFDEDRTRRTQAPPRPRHLVRSLPVDLEAVCLKAMSPEPGRRYPSARAFADDLLRWSRFEPVQARPAQPVRRVYLWSRRNKGWAAAIAAAATALGVIGVGGVAVGQMQAEASRRQVLASEEREREQRRDSLIQQIQRIRLTPHREGWFDQAWDLIRQAASIRRDRVLETEAALCLEGIEVRTEKTIERSREHERYLPRAIRFDLTGSRLFISTESEGLQVWDRETDELKSLRPTSPAWLLALRADGTALELVTKREDPGRPRTFEVREVESGRVVQQLEAAGPDPATVGAYALTPDASHMAVIAIDPVTKSRLLRVWRVETAHVVRETPIAFERPTTVVALSPDGRLVAVGDGDGRVTVWPLPEGEPIGSFAAGRVRINVLQFGPDPVVRFDVDRNDPTGRWLLAAGDSGGSVTVWDLRLGNTRSLGRGSNHDVSLLAFSPDGTILASTGRNRVRLWDVSSGRLLLQTQHRRNRMTALSFSPDGKRLALGSPPIFGYPGGIDVWELEDGRGLRSLRGLQGQVQQVAISPDGKWIAALEQGWQVGVWENATGRLKFVFQTPVGITADNAGLAFSTDGQRLAFATSGGAALWDLGTGQRLRKWDLVPALLDNLAFLAADQLLLFRVETEEGRLPPTSDSDPRQHPRICRIRNLLGPDPRRPVAEITDFGGRNPHSCRTTPDGTAFVVHGLSGRPGQPTRATIAYDPRTGRKLWTIPSDAPPAAWGAGLEFDPAGRVLALDNDGHNDWQLLAWPDRTPLGARINAALIALGPGARRWLALQNPTPDERSWSLWERGRDEALIELGLQEGPARFSRDGRFVAVGRTDGSVSVLDLVEVQSRLAGVGLGW